MRKRTLLLAIAAILTIFAFVSCSNEVAPLAENKLGMITLGDNSRTVGYTVAYSDQVEELYWYYKAEKIDDGYKTGQKDSLTPVFSSTDNSDNDGKGLSGRTLNSDGFSYGFWKIELRGFSDTSGEKNEANAKYKATIDSILVSNATNNATAIIEMGDGATTEIVFGTNGIYFESGNITNSSTFKLTVTDSVDNNVVGTVKPATDSGLTYTITDSGTSGVKRITVTNMKYVPETGADGTSVDITGTHKMTFVLTQTLKSTASEDSTYDITAATYELNFIVKQGTTTTISGAVEKKDDTGSITINGVQNVPELVIPEIIPVTVDVTQSSNKVATVASDTTITFGDFSVVYPAGAVISTAKGDKDSALSSDSKTSGTTIKFEYDKTVSSTDTGGISVGKSQIALVGSETAETFDLGLTAAKGTNSSTKNTKLLTIKKNIGANKSLTAVYHENDNNSVVTKLENLPTVNQGETLDDVVKTESYHYDKETGVLTLYLYHASSIYFVTTDPVASVGTQEYNTLQEAVSAATTSGTSDTTIKLLSNLNLTEAVTVSGPVTLDINNKLVKLTTKDNNTGSVTVSGKGSITVVNKNADQQNFITGVEIRKYSGECTYYSSFDNALAAASNGDTITLEANDNFTASPTKNWEGNLTINLNGKTLTVTNSAAITVGSGTVTVTGRASGDTTAFVTGAKKTSGNDEVYYPYAVSVTTSGVTTNYASIEDAFAAAVEGSTVKLIKDAKISSPITVTANVTLDLNGKTVASSGDNLVYVSSGKLTVKGAAGGQKEFVQGAKGASTAVDGEYSPRVARVGEAYYATFEDAFRNAEDGATISLISNVSVENTLTLKKNLTIDLGQKTLKFADGKNLVIQPYAAGDTTENKTSIKVAVKNGTIDGGSGNCSVIKVDSFVDLTLDAIKITADKVGYANCLVFLVVGADPAKLTIQNGSDLTMYGAYGVGTNATINANVEIIVKDSRIKATGDTDKESVGLFVNVSAKVTLDNATISGEKVGLLLRGIGKDSDAAYKAVIKDSTISSTGTASYEMYSDKKWGSGTAVPAAAIVIGSKNGDYHRATAVEFVGTNTLSHASSSAVDIYVYQENDNYPVSVGGKVGPGWMSNSSMNGAKYPTAWSGGTCYYGTLQNAIDSATENSEIGLCRDVAENLVLNGKNLTIDFNGYTIEGSVAVGCSNSGFYSSSDSTASTVTFEDSGVGGGIKNTDLSKAALSIKNGSGVTIKGGSFETEGKADDWSKKGDAVILIFGSTLTINGGSFKSSVSGENNRNDIISVGFSSSSGDQTTATIKITGGDFSTDSVSWGKIIDVPHKMSTLNLTIDGGTFSTDGTWGNLAAKPAYGKIVVNNCSFTAKKAGNVFDVKNIEYKEYNKRTTVTEGNEIEVNGGVFTIGEGTNTDTRGFVYCNCSEGTVYEAYGYMPGSLDLNGGKINCGTIHKKILEESNCELVQDSSDTSYYIVTPKNS